MADGLTSHGGIEFAPGEARAILLAGDETAAPAIARILEDVGRDVQGVAFIEIPEDADILSIATPPGVEVRWLPRSGSAHGTQLVPAVLDHLGASAPAAIQESGVVTTLRRHLVKDLGVDRSQVAFMGYWRHGVAMRG